jgi:hypothetical protein
VVSEPIDPVVDEAFAADPNTRQLPYWLIVVFTVALAAAPSLHWSKRFSLRSPLITTTLVAVGLGLIVWLR